MKSFTGFIRKTVRRPKVRFALTVAAFYGLIMALYLYLMYANLSTAPEFVYSQF